MIWYSILLVIILVILFILWLIYSYRTYNLLVSLKLVVDKQFGNVQAFLIRKFNLIPALERAVVNYTIHEKGVFKEVTELRSKWEETPKVKEKIEIGNKIEELLSKLLLIQENYPKLKANISFENIMNNINIVEEEITRERIEYNQMVSIYNIKVQEFPSNIVAWMFNFKSKEFFNGDLK